MCDAKCNRTVLTSLGGVERFHILSNAWLDLIDESHETSVVCVGKKR